jgi:hypothetical protein
VHPALLHNERDFIHLVRHPDAPARVITKTIEAFGGLDILVNNAGGPPPDTKMPRFGCLEIDTRVPRTGHHVGAAERQVAVRRRDNANGARAKSPTTRTIPIGAELIRLYADYLHAEYGDWTATTCSSTCGHIRAGTR